jgi:hypothetical protein
MSSVFSYGLKMMMGSATAGAGAGDGVFTGGVFTMVEIQVLFCLKKLGLCAEEACRNW